MGGSEGRHFTCSASDRRQRGTSRPSPRPGETRQGLYDPRNDRDSCGVGFVVNLRNQKSHKIIESGLQLLSNLEHRGAVGADPLMGDGAGLLCQIPHRFFAAEAERLGFDLPPPGEYAVGSIFLPQDPVKRGQMESIINDVIEREGQKILGWRDVPTDNSCLSQAPEIKATEPVSSPGLHRPRARRHRRGFLRTAPVHRAQGGLGTDV